MDASIERLAGALKNASQKTETARTDFDARTGNVQEVYDARIKEADAALQGTKTTKGLDSQIAEVGSEKYLRQNEKEFAKQGIDRRMFVSESVKEKAKKEIGKSDIDRLAEAVAKSSDRSEKVAREMDKKETSRDSKET